MMNSPAVSEYKSDTTEKYKIIFVGGRAGG